MLCQQGEGCIVNKINLQILLRLLFLFKVTGVALNARALSHRAPYYTGIVIIIVIKVAQ